MVVTMSKIKTSEEEFGLAKQPANICPDIDGFLTSLENMGEEDEDGDLIEIEPDWASWKEVGYNVEELKNWQESWIEIGDELSAILSDIKFSIDKINNEDENITSENDIHYKLYSDDAGEINHLIIEVDKHMTSWRKNIKSSFQDLEYEHSSIESSVSNNEKSESEIESYRKMVEDFRELGNYFKPLIRDNAFDLLPELCNRKTFEDIYEDKIENEIKNESIIQFLNEKEEILDIKNKIEKQNKTRKIKM